MALTDLEPLHQLLPPGFPAGLQEIAEWLYLQLIDEARGTIKALHLPPSALAGVALRQVQRLSTEMGGGSVYLHKGVSYQLTPRNRKMCAEFRGDYRVLARKYKLSEQQVRNVIDRWQREQYLARQGDIFGA